MSNAAAVRVAATSPRWRDRAFFTGMSLAAIAAVLRGFARSYFFRSSYFPNPLAPVAQPHGAIFVSWIVLFFVQTVLVVRRRVDLHRRLGVLGGLLAVAMVVAGTTIAVVSLRFNYHSGHAGALSFFAIPMFDMLVFPILVGAALIWRRRPETHKRLMLLATISVLDAAVARWPLAIMAKGPIAFFAITDLFIVAGIAFDAFTRKRVHAAYLWAGLLIAGTQALRLAIRHTDAWIAFARLFAA